MWQAGPVAACQGTAAGRRSARATVPEGFSEAASGDEARSLPQLTRWYPSSRSLAGFLRFHLVNGRMETDQDSQSIAGEQREGAARIEHQPSCPQAKPQRRNSTHAVNC